MKSLFTYLTLIVFLMGAGQANAQKSLVHYWHFNNLSTGTTAAGPVTAITPVHANYSKLDSTKALIKYIPKTTVSSKYATYWDSNSGDTTNTKRNAPAGLCLRVRNPSDSMQLQFVMPTTHYKNMVLKFALEKSSTGSGQAKQLLDYSIDGGSNWKNTGLSIKSDSMDNANWNLVTVGMTDDTLINNNPNFIFRIIFKYQNTGTSGNNRFDNISLEGDSIGKKTTTSFVAAFSTNTLSCTAIYPNPATSEVTIATGSELNKVVTICSLNGQALCTAENKNANMKMDISTLAAGMYIVHVVEAGTGKSANIKLIKN